MKWMHLSILDYYILTQPVYKPFENAYKHAGNRTKRTIKKDKSGYIKY